MEERQVVSRYGVYRDLTVSPYEYHTPYGEILKFPSEKKLEMFTRDIQSELIRTEKFVDRLQLGDILPKEIVTLLYRSTYKALYRKIVR